MTSTHQAANALYEKLLLSHPDQVDVLMTAVESTLDTDRELRRAVERMNDNLREITNAIGGGFNLNPRGVVLNDGSNIDRLIALRAERWNTLVLMGKLAGLDLVGEATAILKATT